MRNKILATLFTLGVLGLLVLLFYGVMFHQELMGWIVIGVCVLGGTISVIAVIYYIWEAFYDLFR